MSRIKSLKQHLPITISCVGEVVDGNAASPILSTARDWCAELIMIGSYGDTGARRSGIGSVAAAIVNEAPCSVEVIKLKNERNERSKTAKMAYAAVTHDLKP
jgi:nucleotide-binding universal stress UspA family protein